MRRHDYLLVLVILTAMVAYSVLPARRQSLIEAAAWWERWLLRAQNNVLPNTRGLNIAVLNADGTAADARAFDTYLRVDSGFARYVKTIPTGAWVAVAAQDDAATSLSPADIAALKSLGGTGALAGKRHWAYFLVGRAGLGWGRGLESLDPQSLDVRLRKGKRIAGRPLPVELRVRSAGFHAGSYAALQSGFPGFTRLWRWIIAALRRA